MNWLSERQNYLPGQRDTSTVGSQVAGSSMWSGVEVATTTLLQFVRSIVFARLLMPSDFGVLSLATVFTEFVLIFANFGFNASVIYHKDLEKEDLATSWWGNLMVDGAVAVICICFALISSKFSDDSRTSHIICLLALQFIIVSFGSINMALMRRLFMFKQLAIAKISCVILTFLVSYAMVTVYDLGVYGLVIGMIAGNAFLTCFYYKLVPWLPSFSFSLKHLKKHMSYGGWFLGVNVATYANGNVDRALIGTYLNMTQLGFYEYAANIPLMVTMKLSQVLNSVLFPAFSSLQDDLERLTALLKNVYRYNALLIFPILTGIALVAPDFVLAAYGEKWTPVIEPLRLFCLFGVLRIFSGSFYSLCNGLGKPHLPLKWMLIYLPANALLIFGGIHYFGLIGAISARIFFPIFVTMTLGKQILTYVNVSYRDLFKSICPAVTCCLVMSASVLAVQFYVLPDFTNSVIRLLLQVSTGTAAYIAALLLFYRQDADFIIGHLKKS